MQYQVLRENETLNEIVFYYYNGEFGYLEKILESNIFLYEEGIFLTVGLVIELPDLKDYQSSSKRVSLWT